MSAYVCDPHHFKALARFAAQRRYGSFTVEPRYIDGAKQLVDPLSHELATYYANILYAENVRSVATCYPTCDFDGLPGLCEKPYSIAISGFDTSSPPEPIAILKMLDCLEYQSCETEDWPSTLAYRICESIRRAAIRALPGYDDAPWEYSAEVAA